MTITTKTECNAYCVDGDHFYVDCTMNRDIEYLRWLYTTDLPMQVGFWNFPEIPLSHGLSMEDFTQITDIQIVRESPRSPRCPHEHNECTTILVTFRKLTGPE